MKHIVTPRLLMRPFSESDFGDLHSLYSNPIVMNHVPPFRPLTLDDTKASLQRIILNFDNTGYGEFAVIERKEKRFIGRFGLQVLENTGFMNIDYLFLPDWWHKGYATEGAMAILRSAFNDWGLETVVGVVRQDNKASARVMEKVGMSFKSHVFYYNCDMLFYSLEKPTHSSDSIFRNSYQNSERFQVC